MYDKDVKSWVDGISKFSYNNRISTVKISQHSNEQMDFPWSSFLLSDETLQDFFKALENGKDKFKFTNEKKAIISQLLTEVAISNDIDTYVSSSYLTFNENVQFESVNDVSILLGYLPIMQTVKNQFTGQVVNTDLDVILISRQAAIIKDGDSSHLFDAHTLNGLYFGEAGTIVCDITLDSDSRQLSHEMYHAIIHTLRSYLDIAMYDDGPNQREEICVHFMTDGLQRLLHIKDNFGNITADVSSNEVSAARFSNLGVKSKVTQLNKKSSKLPACNLATDTAYLLSTNSSAGLAQVLKKKSLPVAKYSTLMSSRESKQFQQRNFSKINKISWRIKQWKKKNKQ